MRYIGSKVRILDFIEDVISDTYGNDINATFADLFSGTVSVAEHFKKKGYRIITNDYLHFSYSLQVAKIKINEIPKCDIEYLEAIDTLNAQIGYDGFFSQNYTLRGTEYAVYKRNYFSYENASKIDAICLKLQKWQSDGIIDSDMFHLLSAGLIDGISKVSNTSGTYGAFLKNDDARKYKNLMITPLEIISNEKYNECYCRDIVDLIGYVKGDILYLDPPYNGRQYPPYYHILETAVLYDHPEIYGITGRRRYDDKLSLFCMKEKALPALLDVVKKAEFKHIYISYSTDGIIPYKNLIHSLKEYGTVECFFHDYRRYKSNDGGSQHSSLREIIIYVKKHG